MKKSPATKKLPQTKPNPKPLPTNPTIVPRKTTQPTRTSQARLSQPKKENKNANHVISDEDYAAALMYEDDYIPPSANTFEDPLEQSIPPEYKMEQLIPEPSYQLPRHNLVEPRLPMPSIGGPAIGPSRRQHLPQPRPIGVNQPRPGMSNPRESEELKAAIEASLKDLQKGNKVCLVWLKSRVKKKIGR